MIGETLLQSNHIPASSPPAMDAIAIGSGPSFFEWVRGELPAGRRYGAGVVSQYLALDVCCIGDLVHRPRLQIGTLTYASRRVFEALDRADWLLCYDTLGLPHGGSSGGMCVSLAALFHQRIGLVGFDGLDESESAENARWNADFRRLLTDWQSRGRTFVSLMPTSRFDDVLQRDVR